jgi:hypothetical protein
MALEFRHSRVKALPLVADADPNVTPPAAADIFVLNAEATPNLDTLGHLVTPEFNAEEAATASFTTWVRNAGTGKWHKLSSEVAAPHRAVFRAVGTMSGDIFVQVTAVAGVVAATALTIRAAESI